MARDVSILMWVNTFRGTLKGVGPRKSRLFGPYNFNEQSNCHLGLKKSSPPPPQTALRIEAEFLEVTGTKVLMFSLLAIHSHLN
jgi:hypothetical protein